jgi:hypothetical protein
MFNKQVHNIRPRGWAGQDTRSKISGVSETIQLINQTPNMIYAKNRQGILLPVEPKAKHQTHYSDTSGLVLTKTWDIHGRKAGDLFYRAIVNDESVDPDVREVVKKGNIKPLTGGGYSLSVSYLITPEEINNFSSLYIDGFDLILSTVEDNLKLHPYSAEGTMHALMHQDDEGYHVNAIQIVTNEPDKTYWISCFNGDFPVNARCNSFVSEPYVIINEISSVDGQKKYSYVLLKDALSGKLKLFETRDGAKHFSSGDQNKERLLEAETELKALKLAQTAKDNELSAARYQVEHAAKLETLALEHNAKLETLALERKNMQLKSTGESMKFIPIIITAIGAIASFFAAIF